MIKAFDHIASDYDQSFTATAIGQMQRRRVWTYLHKVLNGYSDISILELNCGTGEDAYFLAELGHQVLATDVSSMMLKQTIKKSKQQPLKGNIETAILDLNKPSLKNAKQFDLIFSNFGGLNCISNKALSRLNLFLKGKIKQNGHCILVIMPPKTLLDKWYRWYKKDTSTFKKRNANIPLYVKVGKEQVATYYHSPKEICTIFTNFQCQKILPISFIPSYLNGNKLSPFLSIMDKMACRLEMFSAYSDHFLIHLQKH